MMTDKEIDLVKVEARNAQTSNEKSGLLNTLAEKLLDLARFDDALSIAEEAFSSNTEQKDAIHAGKSLNIIGRVYREKGNNTLSLEYFEKARALFDSPAFENELAGTLNNIGITYERLSDFDNALLCYQEGLIYSEKQNNNLVRAKIITNIAIIYLSLENYPKAIENASNALLAAEQLNNKHLMELNLGNLGIIYQRTSEYAKALEFYQNALDIASELENKTSVANHLCNMGNLHVTLSNYTIALQYNQDALSIFDEIGHSNGILSTMGNIGNIYGSIGDQERAIEYYNKSLQLSELSGNKLAVTSNLINLGLVMQRTNRFNEALEYYTNALEICESLQYSLGIAMCTGNIGEVYGSRKDFQGALDCFFRSLSIHKESNLAYGKAIQNGNIGIIYSDPDFEGMNLDKSKYHFSVGIQICIEYNFKKEQYILHKHLADICKREHNWEEYSEHIEKYHELTIEVQNDEVKKQADKFGWERKIADMEKQKEIEAIKTDADKRLLEETISFQKQSLEQQAREVKNTVDELVRKNSLLQLIQSDLKKIVPHTKREGSDYIDQLLERVSRNITPLESNQELDKQLTEVHGEFIRNLHQTFPDLTTMELKIAALLSMKLTSSNIAAALFLAKRTVESHRFSLRKKMGLGTSDDIYQALAQYAT
jgi:tetratricopeptide (TPR) repeat protein